MLQSTLAFVFVLGVLVFVHELGHFLMARRIGVRVLTFSLGFGPKLLRYQRGDTEYCISAIPLGGYVKMAGETAEDPRSGRDDEFLSKTKWQRFQVLIMGPAMNVLLAIVVMAGVLYRGADVPAYESQPPVVGSVVGGSPAERAGIEPGDRIVSVAGREVPTWERFFVTVMPRANREIELVLERDGQRRLIDIVPDAQTKYEMGDIGVLPELRPQVQNVLAGEAADEAGFRRGDVILAVDGRPVDREFDLRKEISSRPGEAMTFTMRRGDQSLDLVATPRELDGTARLGFNFTPYEVRTIEPGPLQAVQMSVKRNLEWSTLIFQTLGGLILGETSPRQLMGPVGIAQLSGGAAEAGWIPLLTLLAMISLNLGIINLLPIPVLDGGHIFIMALEGIARRDFSVRLKEKMLMAGLVVLMVLMVTVIYNDLTRVEWVERLMPWR
jgi:regulator of sigma E protease